MISERFGAFLKENLKMHDKLGAGIKVYYENLVYYNCMIFVQFGVFLKENIGKQYMPHLE